MTITLRLAPLLGLVLSPGLAFSPADGAEACLGNGPKEESPDGAEAGKPRLATIGKRSR